MSKQCSSGFTVIQNSDIERSDIKGYDKLIYLILLRFKNNDTGKAYPSQKRLSDISGLSKRTVTRYLKNLENKNIINVEKSIGKNNVYSFINQCHTDTSDTESLVSESHRSSVRESPYKY